MDLKQTKYLRDLRRSIDEHFSLEEMQLLAFDLSVDWEVLPGATKPLKIQSLIMHLARQKRLDDLIQLIHEARPNAEWPEIATPDQQAKDEKMLIPDSEREKELQAYLNHMHQIITQGLGRGVLQSLENFASSLDERTAEKTTTPAPSSLSNLLLSVLTPKSDVSVSKIAKDIRVAYKATVATARAYTQAVLPRLDAKRIQIVIRYLSEVELPELVEMDDQDLSGLDLSQLSLCGAHFGHTNLSKVNFSETDLAGVNFADCQLDGIVLTGAIYNASTKWPPGFDATKYGAVVAENDPE